MADPGVITIVLSEDAQLAFDAMSPHDYTRELDAISSSLDRVAESLQNCAAMLDLLGRASERQ